MGLLTKPVTPESVEYNNIVFISDLHLSPSNTQKNIFFKKKLLSWQGKIDALYMLGDIFDYWLSDEDQDFADIINLFIEFTKHTPAYMILGNHDFLISHKFVDKTKIKIIPDLFLIKLNNTTIMLSHGDTFCTKDIGYQLLKLILQNRLTVAIAQFININCKKKIKSIIESIGQKNNKQQLKVHNPRYSVVDSTIVKHLIKNKAEILIHGHTHNPNKYCLKHNLMRYELPDWHGQRQGGYLLYQNGSFILDKGVKINNV